jgi:hypothetical protein
MDWGGALPSTGTSSVRCRHQPIVTDGLDDGRPERSDCSTALGPCAFPLGLSGASEGGQAESSQEVSLIEAQQLLDDSQRAFGSAVSRARLHERRVRNPQVDPDRLTIGRQGCV